MRQWVKWIFTAVSLTALGCVLLPALRRYPESVHSYLATVPAWQQTLAHFVLCFLFVLLAFRLLNPKLKHLHTFCIRPPIWCACIAAAVAVCAIDSLVGLDSPPFQPPAYEWLIFGTGSLLAATVYWRLAREPAFSPNESVTTRSATIHELRENWPLLESWLKKEAPTEIDFLHHERVACRLAKYLLSQDGTIALIGPFGSGKTSLTNQLEQEARAARTPGQRDLWFADTISCWGFEDSASAIYQILRKALDCVQDHVDCFSIRSLPESYRKVFSAGSDWVQHVNELVIESADPISQFHTISEILRSANARLVLVIEDIDRNNSSRFDPQEVLGLFSRLSRFKKQIGFVLTSNLSFSDQRTGFPRIFEHIELMPRFKEDDICLLVETIRDRCLSQYQDIPLGETDRLLWSSRTQFMMARHDVMPVSTAFSELLSTPRATKHALRRTYQAWTDLHGEVDFDHLLVANALRHAAPQAFDFLLVNWVFVHDRPPQFPGPGDDSERLRSQVRADWERRTQNVEWNARAALELIMFLLPDTAEWLGNAWSNREKRVQGVHLQRYWERVVNEAIDPEHERDQTVLRDTRDWLRTRQIDTALVRGVCNGGDYAFVWRALVEVDRAWDMQSLRLFADQILSHFRGPRGGRLNDIDSHGAFRAVLGCVQERFGQTDVARDWLVQQIQLAMPTSVCLVVDLYVYLVRSRPGIIRFDERQDILSTISEIARRQFRTGRDLIRALHPEQRYDVYQLICLPLEDSQGPDAIGDDWRWLGPVLLDAIHLDSPLMAPKIANLISRARELEPRGVYVPEIVPQRLTSLFGTSAGEVIQLISAERDRLSGVDREYLDQVIRSYVPESQSIASHQTESDKGPA